MIEKYHITSLCAPPTIFRFLIREDMSKFNLSSLEYCTIAGEALNPSVYEQFYKITGIKLRGIWTKRNHSFFVYLQMDNAKTGSMGLPKSSL